MYTVDNVDSSSEMSHDEITCSFMSRQINVTHSVMTLYMILKRSVVILVGQQIDYNYCQVINDITSMLNLFFKMSLAISTSNISIIIKQAL